MMPLYEEMLEHLKDDEYKQYHQYQNSSPIVLTVFWYRIAAVRASYGISTNLKTAGLTGNKFCHGYLHI